MKTIYNEGRVVGLSSYEIYVKHHLDSSPKVPLPSETEWLASLLGEGHAMVLKFPEVDIGSSSCKVVEIPLPADSYLRAANTIRADIFLGEGNTDDNDRWLVNVTSYGPLISNDNRTSPEGESDATDVPQGDIDNFPTQDIKDKISEYLGIIDGIVLQPGTWITNNNPDPKKDLIPDLTKIPILRFVVTRNITNRPYILLSGFENSLMLAGMSGQDGSADPTKGPRENGEFLGPYIFPWANKIVFSAPPSSLITSDTEIKTISENPEGLTRYLSDISNKTQKAVAISAVDKNGLSLLRPYPEDVTTGQLKNLPTEFDWTDLLNALSSRSKINVLGELLNSIIKEQIPNNYIEFGSGDNKIRLYISKDEPASADIPLGSIGIGWE